MTLLNHGIFSNHYHVMPAKTLVYKAMVAMPALCLAVLGAKARIEYDPFEFVSPTPKQNADILAYRGVVQHTAALTIDPYSVPDVEKTRRVAYEWVEGAKQGKLVPLTPVSYDDSTRDGIKSEITFRDQAVSALVLFAANQELDSRQYDRAVSDALLGIQVAQVIKYSDYPTVMQGSIYERRGFRVLVSALPHLTPVKRLAVKKELADLGPRPDKFQELVQLQRFMFIDYLRRMGVAGTKIEAIRPFDAHSPFLPTAQFRGTLLASARDDTLPASQQLERLAQDGEADVASTYSQVVKAAGNTGPAAPSSKVF
jgi:hypothetical protein